MSSRVIVRSLRMPVASAATVTPARARPGPVRVPGDKSISHRYALLAALASGRSELRNYAPGADCHSTLSLPARLSASTSSTHPAPTVTLVGRGLRTFRSPVGAARRRQLGHDDAHAGGDAGGPAVRIDDGRRRVALAPPDAPRDRAAGAHGRPHRRDGRPCAAHGARHGAARRLPIAPEVPSAQVKSAVLLAGLHAEGTTSVTEPRADARSHGAGARGVRLRGRRSTA